MKNCPLAFKESWPLVFVSDDAIICIVDNFVVKKCFIDEHKRQIVEVGIIIDWEALMGKNGLTTDIKPDFYY